MLKDRLLTSAILIGIISLLVYLDANASISDAEGLWLMPGFIFFALGTARDMTALLIGSGRSVSRAGVLVATLIVSTSACVPMLWPIVGASYPADCPVGRLGWLVIGSLAALFCLLLLEMRRYGKDSQPGQAIQRTCCGTFVSLYVGIPMALMVSMRSLGEGNWGLAALLTTLAVTKSADAGAYFTGKTLGRHKLVPALSPGKTWEGLLGGAITATLIAYVCLRWLFPGLAGPAVGPVAEPSLSALAQPAWGALVLGPLLTLAGLVGDLAESLVKRDAGAKDSGSWLPGLGGVWDVTDSMIAGIMPAFLCFAAGVGH